MDLKAFFNLNYGLYIVSTQDGGQDVGCIVNTVTQVTNLPNQLMVAINKENYTCGAVRRAKSSTIRPSSRLGTLTTL